MKGGVTCLGAMFRRKTKSANAEELIVVQQHGSGSPVPALESFKAFSVKISPGNDTTVTIFDHEICKGWEHGELSVNVQNKTDVTVREQSPLAKLEFRDVGDEGMDVDAAGRTVAQTTFENVVGEVEYEGEEDDDDTIDPTRAQETRDCDSDHPLSDCPSELTLNRDYTAHTRVLDNDSARYYEACVNGTFVSNMERENSFTDLEMASGHASDPGVYQTKGLESMCSSPLLSHGCQGEGKETNAAQLQTQVSLGAPSESESMRQPDSLSIISGHQAIPNSYESSSAGGEVRDLSSVACVAAAGSCRSEAAYQYNGSHAMFQLGLSSQTDEIHKRKPWWKVFLVSHRNIHKEVDGVLLGSLSEGEVERMSPVNGYVSDVEARSGHGSPCVLNGGVSDSERGENNLRRSEQGRSPVLTRASEQERSQKLDIVAERLQADSAIKLKLFTTGRKPDSFTEKAGLNRVKEWVSNVHPVPPSLDEDQFQSQIDQCPESPTAPAASFFGDFGECSKELAGSASLGDGAVDADVEMAKAVVRSVNPLSTVAHFSGVGLKVIPSLGMFGSLKTLNLSANSFVRITPGCLPKSLHSLDISRNKIVAIEGLRELIRLRVLNLSFNRISRIGNGLSSCTSLKEVYLVGNKISEVEGLHRLSKLVVLDLSFNKLTTTKSLGQLAANYKSLQALNLLGNDVQSNLGDEQMRRSVTGICPQLVYLNKQALKSVSTREAVVDNVARAALGKELKGSSRNAKSSKRPSGAHQSAKSHRRSDSGGGGGTAKSKPSGKGVASPVFVSQEGHHRKTHHHSRGHDKALSSKELPKGFAPLPPTAYTSFTEQRGRASRQGETEEIHRVQSDGILFREDRHWSSPSLPGGILRVQ